MAAGEELAALIHREIPEGRESLKGNYANLENVAKYCEVNYQKASPAEKAQALQETKNYTTHSLASVAYQINNLATNFLKLLDLQQNQLTDMESSVNHLNQFVMIHKEKVARREIGILTSTRNVPRSLGMKNGIIYPEQTERPIKYIRKSIDYSVFDDIGHGVKSASTPQKVRSPSISSTHSNNSNPPNSHQGAPTTKPPTPPVNRVGSGNTIGRAAGGHYRAPVQAVVPPVAPAQIPSAQPPASPHFPPPPLSDMSERFEFNQVPAPPDEYADGPPSGPHIPAGPDDTYGTAQGNDDPYAATGPHFLAPTTSWIPKHYLEKVVAIYDYAKSKEDELDFSENAVIYVIHKNDDGWWEGVMDGQTGLFPYNYVEPCM